MVLDFLDEARVLRQHKVDRSSFTTETTSSTDSVNVVLLLDGQLVVDDETDLLDIDTTGKKIGGDEDADSSLAELLHDDVTLDLVHLTVHDGDSKLVLRHRFLQFFDPLFSVTVDESLVYVKVGVEVEQDIHLPLLLLNGNVVLADTFERQLLTFDKDLGRVTHEVLGELKNIWRQRGGEERDLNVTGKVFEDVFDLVLETAREHLIGLIESEEL